MIKKAKSVLGTIKGDVFSLSNNIKPLTEPQILALYQFFEFYSQQELEALVWLYIDKDFNWCIKVPTQCTSRYNVEYISSDLDPIPLIHTESSDCFMRVGSIHSHHCMKCMFSYQDDISDLNGPDSIHILFGEYPNTQILCSVVFKGIRYYIPNNRLIPSIKSIKSSPIIFNKKVLTLINS